MSYPETLPAEDPDPFDELKTGAEVAAFVYKRFRPGGLRDLLVHDGSMPLEREWVLLSVRRVLESYESSVIQEWWPDSRRGHRCGRTRTAPLTTAASCAIRAI